MLVNLQSKVLLIGGRSGVGKTSVANELHAQLSVAGVWHCLIEGDNLDLAFPPPSKHGLAERNLAAMWSNYRAIGHHRLPYTNTMSVPFVDALVAAMGDDPLVTTVLLTANDATAHQRLARRELGSALRQHIERGDAAARELDRTASSAVHRVNTDGRTIPDVAVNILKLVGWAPLGRIT